MKEYTMNKKESNLLQKIRELLMDDPSLTEALEKADIEPQRLWDPQDACYVLDQALPRHEGEHRQVRSLLRDHIQDMEDSFGTMTTKTLEHWERYPLDSLIHLLWRMRNTDGEVTFMRGGVGDNKPLDIWKAEIYSEQGNRVMRCFDTDRHNFMYATLQSPEFAMARGEFIREMRDFLTFEEDTVWISVGSTFGILEVTV